jgi:hypothetical protein
VNSKALAIAGITKASADPQPPFSKFQRDANGEPTGYLIEVPAIAKVLFAVQPPTAEYVAASILNLLPRLSQAGITSVFDAGIQGIPQEEGLKLYQSLEQAGKLPVRVVGTYYYNNPKEDPLPKVRALRDEFHSELVRVTTLKLNVDGGDAQHTAAMLQPYADRPGSVGDLVIPAEQLKKIITEANAEGISTMCHCFGDRAVRTYLDGVEQARKAVPTSSARNTLSHGMYIADADIPRFRALDVTAQFSTQWATPDPANLQLSLGTIGEKIMTTEFMRVGDVARTGARIALGTDWPAAGYYSTFKPLEAIQVAVTREMLTGKGLRLFMPPANQTISLAAALKGNTLDAAYVTGMEKYIGSIRVGKMADLIVLDRNLFDIDPHMISKAHVDLTMMNGKITQEATVKPGRAATSAAQLKKLAPPSLAISKLALPE